MMITAAEIERRERELAQMKARFYEENARRYEIITRVMTEEEMRDILGRLTDRGERILFGLEAPEEPRRRAGAVRPAVSGGDLTCPFCGKTGLTRRGLALHKARLHKDETVAEEDLVAGEAAEEEEPATAGRR